MDLQTLSIFRNSLELKEFARGYIAAMPLENKYQDEHDEWHAFSNDIDLNFYVIDGNITATAYKVVNGEMNTDHYEQVYSEKLLLKHLIQKAAY